MARLIAIASCFLCLTPARASSQLPVVGPAGDTSVQDDTIYALASDSTAYPDEVTLTLFDDGIVVIQADGTYSRTFRVVRQALKNPAVRALSEIQLGYDAGHEEFTLNWARVVDPDSGVVQPEPLHMEELDVQVSRNSPIYSDAKRVRISLGGLAVGRIVDYSYTVRDTAPRLPGDLWSGWNVTSGTPVLRSRFLLETPSEPEPRVREVNIPGPTADRRYEDRRLREWSYADLEALKGEPFAADSNGVVKTITTSGWVEWDDISTWYASLAKGRMDRTDAVQAKLQALVPDGADLEEGLEAVHR